MFYENVLYSRQQRKSTEKVTFLLFLPCAQSEEVNGPGHGLNKCAPPISAPPLSWPGHSQGERGIWDSPPSSHSSLSSHFLHSARSWSLVRLMHAKFLVHLFFPGEVTQLKCTSNSEQNVVVPVEGPNYQFGWWQILKWIGIDILLNFILLSSNVSVWLEGGHKSFFGPI